MEKVTKFGVVEYAHLRATEAFGYQEFDSYEEAASVMNALVAEFRVCEMVDAKDGQFGRTIHAPCPNPYSMADKTSARMWEERNPEWRSRKGQF